MVPLPDLTYQALRALWNKHRHPTLLFPNATGSLERIRRATTHMDRSGAQAAMKAVVEPCGIKKSLDTFAASQLHDPPARTGFESTPYSRFTRPRQSPHHRAVRATHAGDRVRVADRHQQFGEYLAR